MKAIFKYSMSPTPGQKYQLANLFGCVRVVWNDTLDLWQEKYKVPQLIPKYLIQFLSEFPGEIQPFLQNQQGDSYQDRQDSNSIILYLDKYQELQEM